MTSTLKFVISCEALNLHVLFNGSCFKNAMSKATQYATNDDKISKDLNLMHKHPFNLHHMSKKIMYVSNLDFLQCKNI
jgi:hypothetical protein